MKKSSLDEQRMQVGPTREVQRLRREDWDEGEASGPEIEGHHPGEQSAGFGHVSAAAASGDGGVVGRGASLGHFVEQVVGFRREMDGIVGAIRGGGEGTMNEDFVLGFYDGGEV